MDKIHHSGTIMYRNHHNKILYVGRLKQGMESRVPNMWLQTVSSVHVMGHL